MHQQASTCIQSLSSMKLRSLHSLIFLYFSSCAERGKSAGNQGGPRSDQAVPSWFLASKPDQGRPPLRRYRNMWAMAWNHVAARDAIVMACLDRAWYSSPLNSEIHLKQAEICKAPCDGLSFHIYCLSTFLDGGPKQLIGHSYRWFHLQIIPPALLHTFDVNAVKERKSGNMIDWLIDWLIDWFVIYLYMYGTMIVYASLSSSYRMWICVHICVYTYIYIYMILLLYILYHFIYYQCGSIWFKTLPKRLTEKCSTKISTLPLCALIEA